MAQQAPSPLGRLHALWTLEGMHQLTAAVITKALQDPERVSGKNAIKLAELHLDAAPVLTEALLALQTDADPQVRYQLLCTLGFIDTTKSKPGAAATAIQRPKRPLGADRCAECSFLAKCRAITSNACAIQTR